MRLGQDSGDLAGDSGKRRPRRRSGGSGTGRGGAQGPAETRVPPGPPGASPAQDPPAGDARDGLRAVPDPVQGVPDGRGTLPPQPRPVARGAAGGQEAYPLQGPPNGRGTNGQGTPPPHGVPNGQGTPPAHVVPNGQGTPHGAPNGQGAPPPHGVPSGQAAYNGQETLPSQGAPDGRTASPSQAGADTRPGQDAQPVHGAGPVQGQVQPGGQTGEPAGSPPGPPGPPDQPGPPGKRPRFARPLTVGALIGWTALSAILPGAAHLRSGHRRTGYILLTIFGALLLSILVGALILSGEGNAGFLARDSTLMTGAVLAIVGAIAWFLLLLFSYISLGPDRLSGRGQIVSGIAVGVLCVAVMAPFALTASTVLTGKETANAIFAPAAGNPTAVPVKHEDPWGGRKRVNFLLVGGDGAGNREGVRTDSMTMASVHVATGNTAMFSLPRNLQHVRFPPGSALGKRFPDGFMRELPNGGLLNEVWQYAEDHPELMPGVKDGQRGPRALMDAIGYTLNLKIDYYALVNMFGFAHLVDAIGGLRIRVERDVPWGGLYGTAGTIKAGYRKLSGEEALWYGRSRVGSDDFSRMARQRCVIGAFAQQATPSVVLTNFAKIAGVAKKMAKTDIPRELLEHIIELGLKVKDARIVSLQFVPPEFYTGSPDWQKIRTATSRALRRSLQPARRPLAATASPGTSGTSGASGATPTATPKPSRTAVAAGPSQTPTQNGEAESLDELCGF
ncbi:LCP family protein [Streptosporangium sp. NPDC002524]|uniref:LCP family protein n=1 Tax=Streptosporangium sp. NPDC002524 TaxID=3154537 RepID=UPI0033318122